MSNNIGESLIELRIATRYACNSKIGKGNLVNLRIKVLYLLSKAPCSPIELMEKLCLLKSNLAFLCNTMIEDGVIYKERKESDKRTIIYKITNVGRKELQSVVDELSAHFKGVLSSDKDIEEASSNIDAVLKLLSFI